MAPSPSQSPSVLAAIASSLPHMKRREGLLASYVLEHAGEIPHLALSELAERAGVAEGTVVRFCKRLGLHGFVDLKLRLVQEITRSQDRAMAEAEAVPWGTGQALERYLKETFGDLIERSATVVAPEQVERAAAWIAAADRTLVAGMGSSYVAALATSQRLVRLGLTSLCHADSHFQTMQAALLSPRDTLLAFSHSGATLETLSTAEKARARGARVVAVTSYARSPLASRADAVILTGIPETPLASGDIRCMVSQLIIADFLLHRVRSLVGAPADEAVNKAAEGIMSRFS